MPRGFYRSRPGTGRADPDGIQGLRVGGLLSETVAMPQLQGAVGGEVCGGTGREEGECVSKFRQDINPGITNAPLYHHCRRNPSHFSTVVEEADFSWSKTWLLWLV